MNQINNQEQIKRKYEQLQVGNRNMMHPTSAGMGQGSGGMAYPYGKPAIGAASNAYDLIDYDWVAGNGMLDMQQRQGAMEKANREKKYAEEHKTFNQGTYGSYMDAMNPYGINAERNATLGQGMSDFYKNGTYATLLQGLGKSQKDFNTRMDDSGNLWQNYLLDMSGKRLELNKKKSADVREQKRYDTEQNRIVRQEKEDQRRYEIEQQWKRQEWDRRSRLEEEAQAARGSRSYVRDKKPTSEPQKKYIQKTGDHRGNGALGTSIGGREKTTYGKDAMERKYKITTDTHGKKTIKYV
ncbi:MAG: hypothetical protein RSA86_07575 [Christensenellaceae bacterium]